MRLIDADALKSALAYAAKDYCNRNGPMRTIDFESLIDTAPTIDAIPVEWLKAQIRPYTGDVSDIGKTATNGTIKGIIRKWQKEQGAR